MKRLIRPWLLVALAAVTPCAMAADGVAPVDLVQRIMARDAALLTLDVRTPEEYAASHIIGARNLPHDQIEAKLAMLPADKNTEIVVYCRSGRRSTLAQATLQKLGYTRVQHLEGDYIGWQAANRPVEPSAAAAPAAAPVAAPAAASQPKP